MAASKDAHVDTSLSSDSDESLHYTRRGEILSENAFVDGHIDGYDAERMRARSALTAEEEKKLLRRMDWRIMPLCALMFLAKNMDSQNVRRSQRRARASFANRTRCLMLV